MQRYAVTHLLRADEVRRTTAVDLFDWAEAKVLTELVCSVHKAGYVGASWPTLERIPFAHVMGRVTELNTPALLDAYEPEEWFVRAVVQAVPR